MSEDPTIEELEMLLKKEIRIRVNEKKLPEELYNITLEIINSNRQDRIRATKDVLSLEAKLEKCRDVISEFNSLMPRINEKGFVIFHENREYFKILKDKARLTLREVFGNE